jgi:hypothetical protein
MKMQWLKTRLLRLKTRLLKTGQWRRHAGGSRRRDCGALGDGDASGLDIHRPVAAPGQTCRSNAYRSAYRGP